MFRKLWIYGYFNIHVIKYILNITYVQEIVKKV